LAATSSAVWRTLRSARRRTVATDTSFAHRTSTRSVLGSAKRASSTVLSRLTSPRTNASSTDGRAGSAAAAVIQRFAFQAEMPYRIDSQ
jgi:hypothetical protein